MKLLSDDLAAAFSEWAVDPSFPLESYLKRMSSFRTERLDIWRRSLIEAKGSTIEPFYLLEPNLEAACMFVEAAFASGAKRVRIGSDDAIGCRGGIVVLPNGKTFQVHRFPFARPRNAPSAAWFSPIEAKRQAESLYVKQDSFQLFSKKGIEIRLAYPHACANPRNLRGVIVDKRLDLDRLGIRIVPGNGHIVVMPVGPNGLLRLATAADECEEIRITAEQGYAKWTWCFRLRKLDSKKSTPVDCTITRNPPIWTSWLDFEVLPPTEEAILMDAERERLLMTRICPEGWTKPKYEAAN